MRRRNLDLVLIIAIAAFNIILAVYPINQKMIQLFIALPLVFVVPGYVLMEAVFQKRLLEMMNMPSFMLRPGIARPLNALERFTLSIGLSITLDIIGGFLLNLFPIGLTTISWLTFLGILTLVFAMIIVVQRLRSRGQNVQSSTVRVSWIQPSFSQFVLFGLAGVVVVFSIIFSINSAMQQPYPGFTQFWLLPPTQAEGNCTVQLGIRNFEGTDVVYRVEMQVNGVSRAIWVPIALTSQQTWKRTVPIPYDATTKLTKKALVDVQLYRMDNPSVVYRHLHVLLLSVGKSQDGKTLVCGTS